jgi:murein tripeptide amidase MpaA
MNTTVIQIMSDRHNISKIPVVFFFGEHPREFISSEIGLYFIKNICKTNITDHTVDYLLDKFNIFVVLVANPSGRKKAEDGNLCQRGNENSIIISYINVNI